VEPVQLAAILGGAALLASTVSVETGISVALIELALGVGLGNVFSLDPNASWLSFIAGFASVVLTFLAGAEVDPDDFRERFGASIAIGIVSFLGPFLAATLLAPLMVLANEAHGQAVLPAFVLGLVMSRHYQRHLQEQRRLRVVAFAFLTPFFFLRGGLNVSLSSVFANLGVLAVLAAAKMIPKLGLVYPLARRHARENAVFTTLLMSTGLTFGTISALYGLSAHIIDGTQFSLLVTVVVMSAIVPTAIAQRRFSPRLPGAHVHALPPEPSELLIGEARS